MTYISPRMREMLTVMKSGNPYSTNGMVAALGLPRNGQCNENIAYNFGRMLEHGFAVEHKAKTAKYGATYIITDAGKKALKSKVTAPPAPPCSSRLFDRPIYTTPKNVFYRNDGNPGGWKSFGIDA